MKTEITSKKTIKIIVLIYLPIWAWRANKRDNVDDILTL